MAWYENAVIYQIYPRSFMDSNNDGIGDINGIISKIKYIKSLNVDAIWLSPIYQSPMKDFGYDISDYRSIDPIFGNMEDLKKLIEICHQNNLKIMMDMVINHSSDKHQWFEKSVKKIDPYTDYYIWKDNIPNNWRACFGGRAWTYNKERGQYYLHSFLKEQPDLNWHNSKCRNAIFNEVRYYLDLGIDGFRLDVINLIGKDPKLKSNPWMIGSTPRPYDMQNHLYDRNTKYTHDYIKELRNVLNEYDDRALLGEIQVQGKGQMEMAASYLGEKCDELNLSFEFSLCNQKLNAKNIRNVMKRWYELCSKGKGRTPCWVLSNHDVLRAITRSNNDSESARLLLIWLILQRGTSVVYMGEEIGMLSPALAKNKIQDPVGKKYWPFHKGRDAQRRPMQWSSEKNMGFSNVEPWLECDYSKGWQDRTVCVQETQNDSMLSLFRRITELRKKREEIQITDAQVIETDNKEVLCYYFSKDNKQTIVILNMSKKRTTIDLSKEELSFEKLKLALSSHLLSEKEIAKINESLRNAKVELDKSSAVVLTN